MKNVSINSEAFTLAHEIKKLSGMNMSQSLKKAWAAVKLRREMRLAIATFQYVKDNGEVRLAKGTLSPAFFQYENKGTGKAEAKGVIRYFDLDANNFRSFRAERLLTA